MSKNYKLQIKKIESDKPIKERLNRIKEAKLFSSKINGIAPLNYDTGVYLEKIKNNVRAIIQLERKQINKSGKYSVDLTHINTGKNIGCEVSSIDEIHAAVVRIKNALIEEIKHQRRERQSLCEYGHSTYSQNGVYFQYRRIGGMIKSGEVRRLAAIRRAKIAFESKRPLTNDRHIGIELEFIAALSKEQLAQKLMDADLGKYVCLKGDGSIRVDRDGYFAHEINIITPEVERKVIVSRVIQVLREADARVNKSCGFHVHLDMRTRDRVKAFGNLVSAQSVLYAMNPKSRKDNQYCKKTMTKDLDKERNGSRYKGVNAAALNKFGTLEIRIHSGTVDEIKVNNWIDVLISVTDADAPFKRAPRNIDSFCKGYNIPSELRSYIIERIRKFNGGDEVGEVSEVI